MVNLKKIDLIQLFKWVFLWMVMVFHLLLNITSGNTNEQITMTPLEQKILDDFKLSKFVVCTDADLLLMLIEILMIKMIELS